MEGDQISMDSIPDEILYLVFDWIRCSDDRRDPVRFMLVQKRFVRIARRIDGSYKRSAKRKFVTTSEMKGRSRMRISLGDRMSRCILSSNLWIDRLDIGSFIDERNMVLVHLHGKMVYGYQEETSQDYSGMKVVRMWSRIESRPVVEYFDDMVGPACVILRDGKHNTNVIEEVTLRFEAIDLPEMDPILYPIYKDDKFLSDSILQHDIDDVNHIRVLFEDIMRMIAAELSCKGF